MDQRRLAVRVAYIVGCSRVVLAPVWQQLGLFT